MMNPLPKDKAGTPAGEDPNEALRRVVSGLRDRCLTSRDVLLIEAPQFSYSSFNREVVLHHGVTACPTIGLQFVKTALDGLDLTIDIFDLNLAILKRATEDPGFTIDQWPALLDAQLAKRDYSVIGITFMAALTDPDDPTFFLTGIARHLRAVGRHIIIGGGSAASSMYDYYLPHGLLDFVVTAEGENRARWLFDLLLERPSALPPQAGIHYAVDGVVREVVGENTPVTLDRSLAASYADVPLEEYAKYGSSSPFSRMAGLDTPYATIHLNRGCRANCAFCGLSEFLGGRGVRQRDLGAFKEELRYLVEERGVRFLDVLDDDFLGTGPLRAGLVEALTFMADLRRRHDFRWASPTGLVAASVDPEIMGLMHQSGCLGFRMGVESGNDAMLKQLRRPSNKRTLRRVSDLIQGYPDIMVVGNYIIGYFRTESFGEILDTYRFSVELKLDWSGFTVYRFIHREDAEKRFQTPGTAGDFIPTRLSSVRQLEIEGVVRGAEVFSLPADLVPSEEQLNEIWFAFNLIGNYIHNKNLKPGGRPAKFVEWVEAIRANYPQNAYMSLFAGLGRMLMNDGAAAAEHFQTMARNVRASEYWKRRFDEFAFDAVVSSPPRTSNEAWEAVGALQRRFALGIHACDAAGLAEAAA